jgi:hypothetical protein
MLKEFNGQERVKFMEEILMFWLEDGFGKQDLIMVMEQVMVLDTF